MSNVIIGSVVVQLYTKTLPFSDALALSDLTIPLNLGVVRLQKYTFRIVCGHVNSDIALKWRSKQSSNSAEGVLD